MKRKDVPVRNNPGIYKRLKFDPKFGKWKDTGKFRVVRRISVGAGVSKKEQAVFDNIADAKAFRMGIRKKVSRGKNVHRQLDKQNGIRFSSLVSEWKSLHYLKLERGSKEQYDKLLPHLDSLAHCRVEEINSRTVFRLVEYWRSDVYPKSARRESFHKELTLLRTVLHFYRKHHNHAYGVPVFTDHFQAANFARKQKKNKQALSLDQFRDFLEALKNGYAPQYFPLALAQFSLGLRIGEACGLRWDCINLEKRVAYIRWVVEWEMKTMTPHLRPRTKTGREKIVGIPDGLLEELKQLKAVHDVKSPEVPLVFHDRGKPFIRKKVRIAYNRTLKDLGITHVSGTHLMRHTAATAALKATGDIHAVKTLLGHRNLKTTEVYIDELLSGECDKIAGAFNNVLGGSKPHPSPDGGADALSPKTPNGGHETPNPGDTTQEIDPFSGRFIDDKASEMDGPVPQCPPTGNPPKLKLIKSNG